MHTDGVTLGNSPNLCRWKSPDKAHTNLGWQVAGITDVDSHKERRHAAGASSMLGSPGGEARVHTAGQTGFAMALWPSPSLQLHEPWETARSWNTIAPLSAAGMQTQGCHFALQLPCKWKIWMTAARRLRWRNRSISGGTSKPLSWECVFYWHLPQWDSQLWGWPVIKRLQLTNASCLPFSGFWRTHRAAPSWGKTSTGARWKLKTTFLSAPQTPVTSGLSLSQCSSYRCGSQRVFAPHCMTMRDDHTRWECSLSIPTRAFGAEAAWPWGAEGELSVQALEPLLPGVPVTQK